MSAAAGASGDRVLASIINYQESGTKYHGIGAITSWHRLGCVPSNFGASGNQSYLDPSNFCCHIFSLGLKCNFGGVPAFRQPSGPAGEAFGFKEYWKWKEKEGGCNSVGGNNIRSRTEERGKEREPVPAGFFHPPHGRGPV